MNNGVEDRPQPSPELEYHDGRRPFAPDEVEADAHASVWFGYIGMLIILSSMVLGLLSVIFAVLYLLRNALS